MITLLIFHIVGYRKIYRLPLACRALQNMHAERLSAQTPPKEKRELEDAVKSHAMMLTEA